MNIIPSPQEIKTNESINRDALSQCEIFTNVSDVLSKIIYDKLVEAFLPILFPPINREKIKRQEIFFMTTDVKKLPSLNTLKAILKDNHEGYYLKLADKEICIAALSPAGIFYGSQTLMQILQEEKLKETEIIDWPDLAMRGFHLEIRFGIPKFERILEIIDTVASYKINTILIEYEDKFPFKQHQDIVSPSALTCNQIKLLQKYAGDRFMDIIPLQQSLGHLEYVLKHEKYFKYREVRETGETGDRPFCFNTAGFRHHNMLDEICASNEEAVTLVENLLEEMIQEHPESTYVHIGCDEAWNMFYCKACRQKYGEDGANFLFLEHVKRMVKKVTSMGKIPIIWDDMLRKFTDEDFVQLPTNVIIMCWFYFRNDFVLAKPLVEKYTRLGYKVIGASAAKCNERGGLQFIDIPNFQERVQNIRLWTDVAKSAGLDGIITTVWSGAAGTVAPPHPFFDTAWYPVIYSADKYWNGKGDSADFEDRFIHRMFGTINHGGCFDNDNSRAHESFNKIVDSCIRNKYLAEVYRIMSALSAYRLKSMNVYRDLYKIYCQTTEHEKEIVKSKVTETDNMRNYLKPLLEELLGRYYYEEDVREFLCSRFYMDEKVSRLIF